MTAMGGASSSPAESLVLTLLGSAVFFTLNAVIASVTLSLRTGQPLDRVFRSNVTDFFQTFLALVPLAWLVAEVYVMPGVGWWAVLLVVLPVYVIRLAMDRLVAMREMFTQTVASLAQAVDARDHFTSGHSRRVQEISVEIGNVLRVSDSELQVIEWGGLLHDIGKIGVRDAVLLKADRLTKEERAQMNAHPVIGANIIAPVKGLAPELPIIRHHHEWYNGSGYPDRLIGEEIPKLARILHVADAFEAMTAARPYRMTPLTTEQAIAELRRYAGIQFDPMMVDAFVRTKYASGARDPGRESPVRVIPTIGQAAGRMATTAGSPAPGSSPLDAS
jgi:HD superfamily phosphohydrolase YqeK